MTTIINPPAGFTRRADGNVMDVNRQWASRPADEQVFSIEELCQRTAALKASSHEIEGVPWASFQLEAGKGGELLLSRGAGSVGFNAYSFGQFCALPTRGGGLAPATFLSQLSAETAALVLNERLSSGIDRKAHATLLVGNGGRSYLRSITTDKYEREYLSDVAEKLAALCTRGTWGPAEAFRTAAGSKARAHGSTANQKPLPLGWVSDRDMFAALVDYENTVTIEGNVYSRFFLLSDSEVGARSRKIVFGLFDYSCCNMIFWGATQVYEATMRHTSSMPERFAVLANGLNKQLAADNTDEITRGIRAARAFSLGDNEVEVLSVAQAATDLPKAILADAYKVARDTPRYGSPSSVWGMLNGITEVSQTSEHADKRNAIDVKAARLMGLLKR